MGLFCTFRVFRTPPRLLRKHVSRETSRTVSRETVFSSRSALPLRRPAPVLMFAPRPLGSRPSASSNDRPRPHPQLRHHRPYRSWQVDPGRSPDPGLRRPHRARDARAGAGFHGYRARARHHHQGADRPPRLHRQERRSTTSSTSWIRRAMSTSPTRCRAAWPPARARCWWSMPPRAWRRRPWPTSTRPSMPTTRSCPSSTRSICRPPRSSA